MPILDAPPPPAKRGPGRPPGSVNKPAAAVKVADPKIPAYQESLRALAGIGVMVTGFLGQPADSMTVAEYASDETIAALAANATRNSYFGKALDGFTGAGGPILETLILVLPLGLQIFANHGMVKPNPAMGIMPPEVMLARADARARQLQAEADAAVRKAIAEAEAA
jgi:hypothetical protein